MGEQQRQREQQQEVDEIQKLMRMKTWMKGRFPAVNRDRFMINDVLSGVVGDPSNWKQINVFSHPPQELFSSTEEEAWIVHGYPSDKRKRRSRSNNHGTWRLYNTEAIADQKGVTIGYKFEFTFKPKNPLPSPSAMKAVGLKEYAFHPNGENGHSLCIVYGRRSSGKPNRSVGLEQKLSQSVQSSDEPTEVTMALINSAEGATTGSVHASQQIEAEATVDEVVTGGQGLFQEAPYQPWVNPDEGPSLAFLPEDPEFIEAEAAVDEVVTGGQGLFQEAPYQPWVNPNEGASLAFLSEDPEFMDFSDIDWDLNGI